jgi:hypothetical protein
MQGMAKEDIRRMRVSFVEKRRVVSKDSRPGFRVAQLSA